MSYRLFSRQNCQNAFLAEIFTTKTLISKGNKTIFRLRFRVFHKTQQEKKRLPMQKHQQSSRFIDTKLIYFFANHIAFASVVAEIHETETAFFDSTLIVNLFIVWVLDIEICAIPFVGSLKIAAKVES